MLLLITRSPRSFHYYVLFPDAIRISSSIVGNLTTFGAKAQILNHDLRDHVSTHNRLGSLGNSNHTGSKEVVEVPILYALDLPIRHAQTAFALPLGRRGYHNREGCTICCRTALCNEIMPKIRACSEKTAIDTRIYFRILYFGTVMITCKDCFRSTIALGEKTVSGTRECPAKFAYLSCNDNNGLNRRVMKGSEKDDESKMAPITSLLR